MGGGGATHRSLTPLHFQGTETHSAAHVEHAEVQKGGDHGTSSAQLHNEKSDPLGAFILHVMLSVLLAAPRPDRLGLPRMQGNERDGHGTAHEHAGHKVEEPGTSCDKMESTVLQQSEQILYDDVISGDERQNAFMVKRFQVKWQGHCFLVVMRKPRGACSHSTGLRSAMTPQR